MNVDNEAHVYAFAIPSTPPVANAVVAARLKDAPAIEANAPCVLQDLTNALREVKYREHAKNTLEEDEEMASDEFALSFVRSTFLACELGTKHYGVLAGAPAWAQQLFEQGQRTAAAVDAHRIETAAVITDLTNQVREAAAHGRETAAAVADLTNQMREGAAHGRVTADVVAAFREESRASFACMGISLANIEARYQNTLASRSLGHQLVPLSDDQGNFPPDFPQRVPEFLNISNQQVLTLLRFYGLAIVRREPANARRRRLHQFLGIAVV